MGKMKELGLLDCEDRQSIEENFERMKKSSGGDLLETVETEVPLEITWDGDLTGKETSLSGENSYYVKISDIIISNIEDVIDSKIVLSIWGIDNSMVVAAENVMDVSEYGMPAYIVSDNDGNAACLFVKEDFAMGEEAMSAGIWFNRIDVDGAARYPKSLTCPNATTTTTKQQLKPSLIPTHAHKWNDISDAPFYDRSKSAPLNIAYDGDMTGKEVLQENEAMSLVKVSDAVLTYEQIIGTTIAGINLNDGSEMTIVLTAEDLLDVSSQGLPGYFCESLGVYFIQENVSAGVFSLTAGIWVTDITAEDQRVFAKSISNPKVIITTSELKKLDNKFIDAEWMATSGVKIPFDFTYDNNLSGKEYFQSGSNIFVKISDVVITDESVLIGSSVTTSEGIVNNITSQLISKQDDCFVVCYTVYCCFNECEAGGHIMTPGIWFMTTATEGDTYVARFSKQGVSFDSDKPVPLPEKFMPELTQVILISPSGKKFKTTAGDDGVLITTEV